MLISFWWPGPCLNIKRVFPGVGISNVKTVIWAGLEIPTGPPVRGRQLWRRTGNFLLIFLWFYVYDLRFKARGPTTFLAEFPTLHMGVSSLFGNPYTAKTTSLYWDSPQKDYVRVMTDLHNWITCAVRLCVQGKSGSLSEPLSLENGLMDSDTVTMDRHCFRKWIDTKDTQAITQTSADFFPRFWMI